MLPQEPKSCASANSATPASATLLYINEKDLSIKTVIGDLVLVLSKTDKMQRKPVKSKNNENIWLKSIEKQINNDIITMYATADCGFITDLSVALIK